MRQRVEFIIVGGVAAVLNGAPISTFDLDIVHARNDANIDRLMNALTEIQAVYRDQTNRHLRPDERCSPATAATCFARGSDQSTCLEKSAPGVPMKS